MTRFRPKSCGEIGNAAPVAIENLGHDPPGGKSDVRPVGPVHYRGRSTVGEALTEVARGRNDVGDVEGIVRRTVADAQASRGRSVRATRSGGSRDRRFRPISSHLVTGPPAAPGRGVRERPPSGGIENVSSRFFNSRLPHRDVLVFDPTYFKQAAAGLLRAVLRGASWSQRRGDERSKIIDLRGEDVLGAGFAMPMGGRDPSRQSYSARNESPSKKGSPCDPTFGLAGDVM